MITLFEGDPYVLVLGTWYVMIATVALAKQFHSIAVL